MKIDLWHQFENGILEPSVILSYAPFQSLWACDEECFCCCVGGAELG